MKTDLELLRDAARALHAACGCDRTWNDRVMVACMPCKTRHEIRAYLDVADRKVHRALTVVP